MRKLLIVIVVILMFLGAIAVDFASAGRAVPTPPPGWTPRPTATCIPSPLKTPKYEAETYPIFSLYFPIMWR